MIAELKGWWQDKRACFMLAAAGVNAYACGVMAGLVL